MLGRLGFILLRAAILACLGGAGAALLALASRDASADLNRSDMDGYSYASDETRCIDPDKWKDPFTVAFVWGATPDLVEYHTIEHGYGHIEHDDEQRFYDNGLCGFEDVDGANHADFWPRGRYHMRSHTGRAPGGGWDVDSGWGIFSVATPHRDEVTVDPDCDGGGHIVPEDYYGVSGFVAGRGDVIDRWVTNGNHYIAHWDRWYNTAPILQCDNENEPFADGWVAYVAMGDTDGDGCADSEEQEGVSHPLPAGFDPLAWYDFYDVPAPARADPAASGPRSGKVDMIDVLAVLFYFGARDGGPPNGNGVDYDSLKDGDWFDGARQVAFPDGVVDDWDKVGRRYDRLPSADPSPPWGAGPPNTVVDMSDVLAALKQFGLDCRQPP